MDFTLGDLLQFVTNKVLTQAGLVSALLFAANIYQIIIIKWYRQENTELHNKILTLALEQTKVNAASNNVLDKISDMLNMIHFTDKRSCNFKEKE